MTSRDEILNRVRDACAAGAGATPPDPARLHRTVWPVDTETRLARLTTRLRDYGVTVLRVANPQDVGATAQRRLVERGIKTLVIPPHFPADWSPALPVPTEDHGQDARALDATGGVMTGCALAIAETGSIVLDGGAGQGRRAITLLPDYFLCVVKASQVVGIVPEALPHLHLAIAAGRPITFVSGPSATADIELDRVVGVHGPRVLDVILVRDA